jgi:hypothetical protein
MATRPAGIDGLPAGAVMGVQPGKPMFGAITVEGGRLLYESYTVDGTSAALFDYVGMKKAPALRPPQISVQPADKLMAQGSADSLTVGATAANGDLSYQWYRNTTNSTTGGTLIEGAVNASFAIPASDLGTSYYYCVMANFFTGKTAYSTSRVATVRVAIPVQAAALGGVSVPVAGENSNRNINNGTGFTSQLRWSGSNLTTFVFLHDTDYTAVITLTAADNYAFVEMNDTASVAGFTVNGAAPEFVENSGGALILNVIFKTAGKDGGGLEKPDKPRGCKNAGALYAACVIPILCVLLFASRRKVL